MALSAVVSETSLIIVVVELDSVYAVLPVVAATVVADSDVSLVDDDDTGEAFPVEVVAPTDDGDADVEDERDDVKATAEEVSVLTGAGVVDVSDVLKLYEDTVPLETGTGMTTGTEELELSLEEEAVTELVVAETAETVVDLSVPVIVL